jgi:hypothetical protein
LGGIPGSGLREGLGYLLKVRDKSRTLNGLCTLDTQNPKS